MDEKWITVYKAQGKLSAEMVRLLLESFRIPTVLSQESVGTTYGLTVGDLGEVEILVEASHMNAAIEILQAMEDGKLSAEDASEDEETDEEPSVD
jgi:hypothetical protein